MSNPVQSQQISQTLTDPSPLHLGEVIVTSLLSASPHEALAKLFETTTFQTLLPEICRLKGTPQDLFHHPEGDVWTHTLKVIEETSRLLESSTLSDFEKTAAMLGAFLHDIGKGVEGVTVTSVGPDGNYRITAHKHEEIGVQPAREVLVRLGLIEFQKPVLAVVEHHMNVPKRYREHLKGHLNESRCILRTKKFIIESLGDTNPHIVKICTVGDQLGRGFEHTRAEREEFAFGVARIFDEALKE